MAGRGILMEVISRFVPRPSPDPKRDNAKSLSRACDDSEILKLGCKFLQADFSPEVRIQGKDPGRSAHWSRRRHAPSRPGAAKMADCAFGINSIKN
jgi:hypothetical protein